MSDERLTLDEGTVPVVRSAIGHSDKVDKILPDLLKAQEAISHAIKDGENPHFHSSYASLNAVIDACKTAFNENNIVIIQGVGGTDAEVVVATQLAHISGQWYECEMTLKPEKNGPQPMGSCVTYGRRYTLQTLACMGAEDDDGNAGQAQPKPKPKKTGTKKQDTKEADENEAVRKAEAAFHAEWGRVMEAIGEDDLDASKALRHHFVKLTTEGSSGFVVMTDSTGGMSSKEIRLLTAMLTKGHDKVVGHCTGDWREAVGLPALGTVGCEVCNKVLTEAEKSSCAIAKLPGYFCTQHVKEGLEKKMKEVSDEA